jgi:hypothetical protein
MGAVPKRRCRTKEKVAGPAGRGGLAFRRPRKSGRSRSGDAGRAARRPRRSGRRSGRSVPAPLPPPWGVVSTVEEAVDVDPPSSRTR